MGDTDRILDITRKLEYLLETQYGAQGRGLHEKITSAKDHLSPELIRDLRKIATIRNKVFHEYNYNFSRDRDRFFQLGESVVRKLENVNANYSQASNVNASYSQASVDSNSDEDGNNYARNTNYSWKQQVILSWQWVVANVLGAIFGVVAALLVRGVSILIIGQDPLSNDYTTNEFKSTLLSFFSMLLTPFIIIHVFQQMFLDSAYKKVSWWWVFSTLGVVANFSIIIAFMFILLGSTSWVEQINTQKTIVALLIPLTSLPLALIQGFVFKQKGRKAKLWIFATLVDWTIFIQSFITLFATDSGYMQLLTLIASLIVGKIITGFALPNTGNNTYAFRNSM